MNIFKDDLLKNTYFKYALIALAIGYGLLLLQQFYSVEARCERYIKSLNSKVYIGAGNKLREAALESVSRVLIEECVEKGGPDRS